MTVIVLDRPLRGFCMGEKHEVITGREMILVIPHWMSAWLRHCCMYLRPTKELTKIRFLILLGAQSTSI